MIALNKTGGYIKSGFKLIAAIIPTVMLILLFFFLLTRNKIIELATENLALKSHGCTNEMNGWTEKILSELKIYKDVADKIGTYDEKTFDILRTSAGIHESYPYGIYWGDIKGNYFDASGWVPPDDYVASGRNWYREGLEHEEFAFGEPYIDVMTDKICVSVTVRTGYGENESVMATDVYLDHVSVLTAETVGNKIETAFFVTSDKKMIIASSDTSMTGVFLDDESSSLFYKNISGLLEDGFTGQCTVNTENGVYYVNIDVIENTGWYFVSGMSQSEVLADLRQVEVPMILASAAAAATLFFITTGVTKEMSSIRRRAKTDPLTKIFNRDGFKEMVMMGLEARPNQGVMLIIDMDNFKQVNDSFGHPEGDDVLKQFALLLENYFNRNRDVTARIGGDEFAVFVGRNISESEADTMLAKFIEVFHSEFDGKYPESQLSVSIGGSFEKNDMNFESLYKRADKALYEVKKSGKDSFRILS